MNIRERTATQQVRDYYEKEAKLLKDHQKEMYFGDAWNKYWHGTRLSEILRIIRDLAFASFLDVGCAEGYFTKLMTNIARTRVQYRVGLDVARNYLLKARKTTQETSWILGDANKLPFRHNSFDLVICSEVLEHLTDPKDAFKELIRVSKKYVLTSVAGENLFYHLARKMILVKPINPYEEIGCGHVHEMSAHEIAYKWALEDSYKCIKNKTTCYFPVSFFKKNKMPTCIIPFLKILDKCISKIPVIKEFGATQITLLLNENDENSNTNETETY